MSRLADVAAEAELQGIEQIRERGPRIPPYQQADLPWDVTLTAKDGNRMLLRSTDVSGWAMNTRGLAIAWDRGAPGNVFVEQKMQLERRAVQTQIALIAWRKQYGQLPDSLDELLSEPFESLPLDPYTKQPFVYLPNGVVEEIWDDPYGGMGSMMGMGSGMYEEGEPQVEWQPPKRRLVRSAPFLWSPGATLRYAPSASRGPSVSPTPSDFRHQSGQTLSDVRLLYEGVRFLLPKTEVVEESQQPSDSSDDADALPSDE
ncbi:MAG: hypothetical protein H6823_12050 [Planctomycetaceae bacterium]|nr:hypothetical protein [Planctomycetaceae bacterium]